MSAKSTLVILPSLPRILTAGFAERLCAAQIIYLAAHAQPFVCDDLDILALEHALQLFHHRKEI
jgi:hypothetical protein